MRKEKGEFGYLHYLKVYHLLMTLVCLTVVMILVMIGFFRYHSMNHIYTVIAAVMAIPAAKFFVEYLVLIPYEGHSREVYEKLDDDNYRLLTELVITSEQKIMYVDFAIVKGKKVYCCATGKKMDSKELEKYLHKILNSEFDGVTVKVINDLKKFKKEAEHIKNTQSNLRDKRIAELLCIYSM